jgi:hypothetical protein
MKLHDSSKSLIGDNTYYGHLERAFFQKSQTFGHGQANWAENVWSILVFSANLSALNLVL